MTTTGTEDRTTFRARLTALRTWIQGQGLDGLLLTTADVHQSENPPDHDQTLRWLSGFTGSLGHALVSQDEAVLFVDGRYQVQARQQLDLELWKIAHLENSPAETWPGAQEKTIGYDPMLWTANQRRSLARKLALVPLRSDPFQALWNDRPAPPKGRVRQVEGLDLSVSEKLGQVARGLQTSGIDLWVTTRPDDIAWLFNIRGSDVPMNPVALSCALIGSDGTAEWFIDADKLKDVAPAGLTVLPQARFLDRLRERAPDQTIGMDPAFAPAAVADAVAESGGQLREQDDPIMLLKARKSPAELAGYRTAHHADAIAWVRFLAWLTAAAPQRAALGTPVTECEAADRILSLRRAHPSFLECSFATISAAGPNAAMCHYAPSPEHDMPILPEMLYLLDSGGQYLEGTTDATRTLAFLPQSDDRRKTATAVMRGFLSLSMARFPKGTFPHQIDALARAPLWTLGLDYDHGTGHGVGHNLLVHEYPHRFGQRPNAFGLEPGNIMTIEPGYYREGDYGIRVENQVELIEEPDGFCTMRPMTLVPIDLSFIDISALTRAEVLWLNAYHAQVRDSLAPHLPEADRVWLLAATAAV